MNQALGSGVSFPVTPLLCQGGCRGAPARLENLARAAYGAYESGDRHAIEQLLTSDFQFYSPADVGIDRARYVERCWPTAARIDSFDLKRLIQVNGEVVVTYECARTDGTRFCNTEVLSFDGDKINRVEVYFGWELR